MSEWGGKFAVDVGLDNVKADDFDALSPPGGVMNPGMVRCGADGCARRRPRMDQPPTPPGEDASDRFAPSYFGVSDEWH